MCGFNFEFLFAQCEETKFFGRHYGGEQYWRSLCTQADWRDLYLMGGEL
jgi:hypothetical protein